MSKIKALQSIGKFFGYGAKATKAAKAAKAAKVAKASRSNKSVAALSKSIDKFKTSSVSINLALSKKIKATAANTKKIKDAVAANKKAGAAINAERALTKKKSLGIKVSAAEVKKVTDASVAANAAAKKAAAAKRLAEKATAAKKANIAKKVVTGRKVVVAKRTAKAKKADDTKKAAPTTEPTTEPTPKGKNTGYHGSNLDTRAGRAASWTGRVIADGIGKGIAGVIKAPAKIVRYGIRNPVKGAVALGTMGIGSYFYHQNQKMESILKRLEQKNTKSKTIFDKNLYKVNTTGKAAYLKKQALKTKNSSSVDSSAYKKAQAHLDSVVRLSKKK
jgi:hypothetical protein